jgi:hypothetical protein
MFRGQSNPEWKLLPKAGRKRYAISDDKKMFEAWQRRATEFVNPKPNNDWEWLAIAQHHGLSTRLLDWTYQPLIAAFFSVWDKTDSNRDSYLYCFKSYLKRASFKESPFSVKTISKYKPHGVAARIIRQGGLFSIHPNPKIPLTDSLREKDVLELIVIDKNYCKELYFELNHYGVNHSTVFPDLDGLSAHVNWISEHINYWKERQEDEF